MTYPPFKHFTLMEQSPTTASDSAAAKEPTYKLGYSRGETLYLKEGRGMGEHELLDELNNLQAEVAALKELLKKAQPYIHDLQKDNFNDPAVGIRYDYDLDYLEAELRALLSPDKTA